MFQEEQITLWPPPTCCLETVLLTSWLTKWKQSASTPSDHLHTLSRILPFADTIDIVNHQPPSLFWAVTNCQPHPPQFWRLSQPAMSSSVLNTATAICLLYSFFNTVTVSHILSCFEHCRHTQGQWQMLTSLCQHTQGQWQMLTLLCQHTQGQWQVLTSLC